MTCTPFQIADSYGILCTPKTNFKCPKCDYSYTAADYYSRLEKSKTGLIYRHCKGCKVVLGITTDIRGDVRTWLKSEERNYKLIQK